jgi:hypothetical protein
MLHHVVLFRPRKDVSDADRDAMFGALEAAAREIPDVRTFHVGGRITHGATYEKLMTEDFPFAAIIGFDNLSGLKAYLGHPAHDRLGELFYRLQEAALVFDYDEERL